MWLYTAVPARGRIRTRDRRVMSSLVGYLVGWIALCDGGSGDSRCPHFRSNWSHERSHGASAERSAKRPAAELGHDWQASPRRGTAHVDAASNGLLAQSSSAAQALLGGSSPCLSERLARPIRREANEGACVNAGCRIFDGAFVMGQARGGKGQIVREHSLRPRIRPQPGQYARHRRVVEVEARGSEDGGHAPAVLPVPRP